VSENFDRSPPIGIFLSGESFLRSAQYLRTGLDGKVLRLRFDMPIYYLYSHALELTLKAFLRSKGVTDRNLRSKKFRHSLQSLRDACVANGLLDHPVKDIFINQTIDLLDPFAADFEFRYLKVGFKNLPTLEAVDAAVSNLMAMVRPHCEATIKEFLPDHG
jgi:hypothetical protein